VDYAAAITQLNTEQISLQAAQQSYASIARLSLFNYIK
jgi:flagellin-like hook-associated protein FlgL